MRIRGILLDIGDTIVDATRLHKLTLLKTVTIIAREESSIQPESFIRAYQEADSESDIAELADLNHLYSDKRILIGTFQKLGLPVDNSLIARFLTLYRSELRRNLKPDSNLQYLFNELLAQKIRLGIVSNGTTTEQLDQLELLGIKDFFDPILISQAVGLRKPEPAIFLLASKLWDIPPSQILVVGDRIDWEVVGAKRAGMQSALTTQFVDWHSQASSAAEPDFILHRLDDLLEILKEEK
jgi:putative hydrolase of the HAD superfamily